MNIQDRLELGKKCAYGIGQMADLEKAYSLWNGLESLLSAEDKEMLEWIKETISVFGENPYSNVYSTVSAPFIIPIGEMSENPIRIASHKRFSEAEVRELFEETLRSAKEEDALSSLYHTLDRQKKDYLKKKEKKQKKPEHVRLGNNLSYLIHFFWYSIPIFFEELNKVRKARGLEERKSVQGLHQVIHGVNGMQDGDKFIIVEMATASAAASHGKKKIARPLTPQDFQLPFHEFHKLFMPPKFDDHIHCLLEKSIASHR